MPFLASDDAGGDWEAVESVDQTLIAESKCVELFCERDSTNSYLKDEELKSVKAQVGNCRAAEGQR